MKTKNRAIIIRIFIVNPSFLSNGAGADLTALSVRSSDLVRSVLQLFVQKVLLYNGKNETTKKYYQHNAEPDILDSVYKF